MPRYTAEQKAEMVAAYVADRLAGCATIAQRFGCAPNTVRDAVRAAGVMKPSGSQPKAPGETGKWMRRVTKAGYVELYAYVSGMHGKNGRQARFYKLEHRVVMAEMLGRPLETHEQVHHKNGVRHDNRPENLELRIGNHGSGATHCRHCGKPL